MIKEELIKLSRENLRKSKQGSLCECYDEAFIKGYELSEKRIEELEKENAELKEKLNQRRYHNCEECEAFGRFCPQKPKREDYESENQYLIDLECGVWNCKNAIKLLVKENARLKKDSEENQDLATIGYMRGASKYGTKLNSKIRELQEAKTIIQDLLSNSDEYARQRAMDWLREE